MSGGIYRSPVLVKAVLSCDARPCDRRWESEPYDPRSRADDLDAAAPALEAGWTVYSGSRNQHTYCPNHGPKTPMRLVLGTEAQLDTGH